MVMGVRSLPEAAFQKAPIRSGVQVKAGGLFPPSTNPPHLPVFRSSPIMPVVEVGKGKTLCAAVNCVFPLKVTSAMAAAGVYIDVWNAGLVRSGYSVGRAVCDASWLAEDPGQPYAAWVPLKPVGPPHHGHHSSNAEEEESPPTPLRFTCPVQANVTWGNPHSSTASLDSAHGGERTGVGSELPTFIPLPSPPPRTQPYERTLLSTAGEGGGG